MAIPSVEPLGTMSLAMNALSDTIAKCPAWQDWCGASEIGDASAAYLAAKDRVHLYHLPAPEDKNGYTVEELEWLRPAIGLTYIPPSFGNRTSDSFYRDRTATGTFSEKAVIYAHIVDSVIEGDVQDTSYLIQKFTNNLGLLIDSMCQIEDTVDGCVYLQSIGVIAEPHRVDQLHIATHGDFVTAMLRVHFGV